MSQIVAERGSREIDDYLAAFEHYHRNGATRDPAWLTDIRRAAISRFAELGFPGPQSDTRIREEWKYSNVAPIAKLPFRPAAVDVGEQLAAPEPKTGGLRRAQSSRASSAPTAAAVGPFTFGQPQWSRLVFVNGVYSRELSSVGDLPRGVRLESLADAVASGADGVEQHLARHAGFEDNAFVALNTAFIRDGAFVYVPRGRVVEEPIHVLYLSTMGDAGDIAQPRNLVVVESGGMATLVESHLSLSDGAYFTNAVTEAFVGDGAVVDHYKIQREGQEAFHIATTQVHQERESTWWSCSIAMGAKLARDNLNVLLNGEGCDSTLNGLYLATGDRQVDNHTAIDHAKPHCTSFELYKGIVDGNARAVFNGKIFVREDAQRTDAKQLNQNLLLSETAEVDTKPQLEIFADDVKCTHGATVGQLPEEALFYLQTRGLSRAAASSLLTYGFAREVVSLIKSEPIRAYLDGLLLTRFLP